MGDVGTFGAFNHAIGQNACSGFLDRIMQEPLLAPFSEMVNDGNDDEDGIVFLTPHLPVMRLDENNFAHSFADHVSYMNSSSSRSGS